METGRYGIKLMRKSRVPRFRICVIEYSDLNNFVYKKQKDILTFNHSKARFAYDLFHALTKKLGTEYIISYTNFNAIEDKPLLSDEEFLCVMLQIIKEMPTKKFIFNEKHRQDIVQQIMEAM